jgi:predicted N-formylglutamate amidohydrolase
MMKNPKPLHANKAFLISCEHAVNRIVPQFAYLFPETDIFSTHWAYDAGALHFAKNLTRKISMYFRTELICGNICRLLVDLNRPTDSKTLFTRFSGKLEPEKKEMLLHDFHNPYWYNIRQKIEQMLQSHPFLIHISVHSFTPELKNINRRTDIGLLFDRKRIFEQKLCANLKKQIKKQLPEFKTHYNLPYRGTHDGLTASLRQEYPVEKYIGLELELNQKFLVNGQFEHFAKELIPVLQKNTCEFEVDGA